jgi:hypothetical protein
LRRRAGGFYFSCDEGLSGEIEAHPESLGFVYEDVAELKRREEEGGRVFDLGAG